MDGDLTALAEAQHGFLTTGDLLRLGYTNRAITSLVAHGHLVRIRQGAYSPTIVWRLLDDVERHRVMARAVHRRHEGRVALCGASALLLRGVSLWGVDLGTVQVWRIEPGTGRQEAGVRHHRGPAPRVEDVDGVLCAGAEESLWQVLCANGIEPGLVAIDSAAHGKRIAPDPMREVAERGAHDPGARRATIAMRLCDPGAETPGETRNRYLCFEQGLPAPRTQLEVRDGSGLLVGRSDLGWEEHRHLGEFDGRVKYMRSFREGEDASAVVVREKERQDALADEGWGMTRVVWDDLAPRRRAATAATIRRGLERSRRAFGHLARAHLGPGARRGA